MRRPRRFLRHRVALCSTRDLKDCQPPCRRYPYRRPGRRPDRRPASCLVTTSARAVGWTNKYLTCVAESQYAPVVTFDLLKEFESDATRQVSHRKAVEFDPLWNHRANKVTCRGQGRCGIRLTPRYDFNLVRSQIYRLVSMSNDLDFFRWPDRLDQWASSALPSTMQFLQCLR